MPWQMAIDIGDDTPMRMLLTPIDPYALWLCAMAFPMAHWRMGVAVGRSRSSWFSFARSEIINDVARNKT